MIKTILTITGNEINIKLTSRLLKEYNFDKFTSGISQDAKLKEKAHTIIKKHLDEDYNEDDPIKIDNSDSKFLFDNEDAIVVDLKKGNSN